MYVFATTWSTWLCHVRCFPTFAQPFIVTSSFPLFFYLEPLSPKQHNLSWPAAKTARAGTSLRWRGLTWDASWRLPVRWPPGCRRGLPRCRSEGLPEPEQQQSLVRISINDTNKCVWPAFEHRGHFNVYFSQRQRLSRDGNLIETRLHFATPQYD